MNLINEIRNLIDYIQNLHYIHAFISYNLQGSINAIAGNNNMLALGGFSEIIKLYDLKTRKEKGELMEHTGSITYLQFYETQYLISGAEDGIVIIWRVKDWVPLHKLRVKK